MATFYTDPIGPWSASSQEHLALIILHYAFPVVVFTYYMISSSVAFCTLRAASTESKPVRTRLLHWLLFSVAVTYLVQLLVLVAEFLATKTIELAQDTVIGLLSCILVYGVVYIGFARAETPAWYPYIGTVWIALLAEPVVATLTILTRPTGTPKSCRLGHAFVVAGRYAILFAVVAIYYGIPCLHRPEGGSEAERQPLLQKEAGVQQESNSAGGDISGHGSVSEDSADHSQIGDNAESSYERRDREARERMEKRLKEHGNWLAYAKSFLIFFPYVWPVNNKGLQLRAALVGVCLLASNVLNLLIPRQLGIVTDSLDNASHSNPWVQVLILAALKLLDSQAGITLLRQWLWLPVEYYSEQAMAVAAYSHVLNLSSDFHDSKSSSDIMTAISAGSSISDMLESLCFRAVPMFIDFAVALTYLSVTFGPYEGFITIATATMFIHVASYTIVALKGPRRTYVSTWYKEHYVQQAGIQGWSTVACFNQIGYEEDRYREVSQDKVDKTMAINILYYLAYALQYLTTLCGLLAGLLLAVHQVTTGRATSGQFIMLLTYWNQLVSPLSYFATLGKTISKNLIQAEQLLEIMQTKATVVSKEGAPKFDFKGGRVQLKAVGFSYDKKKDILKDVNMDVAPGTTVAFVGQTGAGKSTILKLLDRFYDVTEGSIEIDGQDIRDVDLSSLRAQIGVVQQSPILFDDTIMNNVRYGNMSAADEEVFAACKAACIHEQILGFTDGYNTQVGERGVKLSGGELQRVAIARAILKRPAIVLLDEATSAVDTDTEQKIQDAFRTLCKGRTTFIVAHRLSTIINADRIVVIDKGRVAEQGSHDELVRAKGKYAELWSKQIFTKPKGTELTPAMNEFDNGQTTQTNGQSDTQADDQAATLTNGSKPLLVSSDTTHISTLDGSSDDTKRNDDVPATPVAARAKEPSRLNPDAPTFTPRSAAAVAPVAETPRVDSTTQGAFSETTYESEDYQASTPVPHHVHFANSPVVYVPGVYPVYTDFYIPTEDEMGPVVSSRNTSDETGSVTDGASSAAEEAVAEADTGSRPGSPSSKICWRKPWYSKRVQSKSEPSTSSSAVED